jgi:hypothetical protein
LLGGFRRRLPAAGGVAGQPAKQRALSTASAQTQFGDQIARVTSLNPNEIEVHAANAMIRVPAC